MRAILLQRCSAGMRASPVQRCDPSLAGLRAPSHPGRAVDLGAAGAAALPTSPTAWCTALAAAKLAGDPIGCVISRRPPRLSCCRERGHHRTRQRQALGAAQALHHPQWPVLALRAGQYIHACHPVLISI